MIVLSHSAAIVLALILALWLAVAVGATVAGIRRLAAARSHEQERARLAELIDGAPAIPLVIDGEGRMASDSRLADWLGLKQLPRHLADLAGEDSGFARAEAEALARDAIAVQRAGVPFVRALRVQGSTRVLAIHGRRSSRGDRAVLWFFDTTAAEQEIHRLSAQAARLGATLESLAGLIEVAPFPMWHRAPDLRLALVNSAYVAAVEAGDAADVIARGLELFEAQDGGPVAAAARARDSGETLVRTVPATIDGQRRAMRVVDVPLGAAGIAGYAIDIEELEEARADLGRFVRAQRDMLDLLSASVAQFGADRNLVFSNQPFSRLFALKPEWLADRPEFDRVLERMREANRLPESRDFPSWKADRRAWFTAGREAIEENWLLTGGTHLRVLAQPMPDGGLLLVFEDRTEQVKLAIEQDTMVRVRAATFDNLFEAVAVFASDGRLSIWNKRFRDVWGMSEAELARHPRVDALVEAVARTLATPSRAGVIRDLVRIATNERQQRTGRVSMADGRHFEFAAVPLPDGNALFTMLDVTDSRRIERALRDRNEALEEGDKIKNSFVASMSYELRTPLTSIGGFAEMLAAGYAGKLEPRATDYVAAILESVAKLGALIDNVLDFTQVEAGSLPLAEETVDLATLTRAAAEAIEPAAQARPVALAVKLEPSAGAVTGDPRRLRQAIDQLLKNAVAYTQPGGRVLLGTRGDADWAEIYVSDNGPGIAPEEQEKVFARFHSAGSADGRPAAGLGLPLTRQFVEAHGGTVTLQSEPGEGTTLVIRLPRAR